MRKTYQLLLGLLIGSVGVLLMAAAPEWIQYNERVVGENSPYFDDVVNRPAKQIWSNFTSQHTDSGEHKAFIFPTPIPTLPFPTPLPTATPGPDFPTPLPTATPIPAGVFTHVEDISIHHPLYPELIVSTTPYTIDPTDGSCHGRLIITTIGTTITLPSDLVITANKCHTVRVMIAQSSGGTSLIAGANTFLFSNASSASDDIYGSYVEFFYSETLNIWILAASRGEWLFSE